MARIVVRGASIAGGGYVVAQAISLATYLALARLVSPADFGAFAAGTVVVGIGLVAGESGMLGALIQRQDRIEEAFNSALIATLAGGVALTAGGLAVAPLVGLYFHSHRTAVVAAVMAGTMLPKLAMIVPNARLQRNFSFMRRVVIDPLGSLAFAGGSVIAAAAGLGVWALVIGTYAQLIVDVGAAWTFARWRPRPRTATVGMWRELARFGRPLVGGEFIRRLTGEIPVLALGRFGGTKALGEFSYALRVALQPISAIIDVGSYVLLPAFARIAGDDERFQAGLVRALRWLCAIAFPLGLLLIPLGTPAVVIAFGHQWREAGHGVMALGAYSAALALESVATEAWKAAGRPEMLPRIQGLLLLLTVVCVGALVPFGVVGVTIGMAISAIGIGVYAVRGIAKVIGIPLHTLVGEIWPTALAATAMAAAMTPIEQLVVHADRHGVALGLALLAAEAVLAIAIYVACLSVLAPNSRRELLAAVKDAHGRRLAGPA